MCFHMFGPAFCSKSEEGQDQRVGAPPPAGRLHIPAAKPAKETGRKFFGKMGTFFYCCGSENARAQAETEGALKMYQTMREKAERLKPN